MTDHTPPRSDKDPRFPPMCTPVEDFHSVPHQKLQAMVEHADAERVIAIGHKLSGAAKAIKKLGDDLKKHMEGVVWSGEAGEAFRSWGHSMANETIRLSEYVGKVDEWMGHASTNLRSATNMPKYSPEDRATVDAWLKNQVLPLKEVPPPWMQGLKPDSPLDKPTHKEAYDAQQRLLEKHKAAAALMKALSESYDQTGTQLLRAERPNFRPMPRGLMPDQDPEHGRRKDLSIPGDGSGEPSSDGAPGASSVGYAGGTSASYGAGGVSTPSGPVERHVRRPELDLSGGVDTPHRVPIPQQDRPPATLPDVGKPQTPMPHVPVPGWPGTERRPDQDRWPGGPTPDRRGRPAPRTPSPGPGTGNSRRPDARVPSMPRDGIVGGRPTPRGPSVPVQNPGRFPAFGMEPSQRQGQARPPMAPGANFSGALGPTTGSPGAGRARATESGGIVGSRPGQIPGRGGSAAFTSGGTGLVRGGATGEGRGNSSASSGTLGGFMPAAGASGASSERRSGGRRPDYLVEDEETWNQGGKNVVPPVIE
ncbi:WXG100 family type VII secretion target [Streptomyces nondiastaticus]|uniref:Uncharacterized protein n=1 Tax=Streptomyces nondiastaticus TaxID=3154512 RepID=A0ABW6U4P7_9ACTN